MLVVWWLAEEIYKELLLKYGAISFYDFVTHGIAQPKFYGDLVLKLRKVVNNVNFRSSCSRIIKKFLYRKYDKDVIRQTLLMIEGTYTTFNLSSLFPCTLTGNARGNQWRAHPKPFQRWMGLDYCPLCIPVGLIQTMLLN